MPNFVRQRFCPNARDGVPILMSDLGQPFRIGHGALPRRIVVRASWRDLAMPSFASARLPGSAALGLDRVVWLLRVDVRRGQKIFRTRQKMLDSNYSVGHGFNCTRRRKCPSKSLAGCARAHIGSDPHSSANSQCVCASVRHCRIAKTAVIQRSMTKIESPDQFTDGRTPGASHSRSEAGTCGHCTSDRAARRSGCAPSISGRRLFIALHLLHASAAPVRACGIRSNRGRACGTAISRS